VPLVSVQQLSVNYGDHTALSAVDLTLWPSDRLAVIGPNGAGKTTLLRALLGLVPASRGRIIWNPSSPRIGYVPQRLGFDSHFPMTAAEFLAVNHPGTSLWFGGVPRRKRAAIAEVLEKVGAASLARQMLGTLSGGQLQRVLIAAGLLQNPQIMILDEPSASIDHRGTEDLLALLLNLHRQDGITLLFVSHDWHLVNGLADRVACLNGTLCGVGTPAEILQEQLHGEVYGRAFSALPGPGNLMRRSR